MVWQKNGQCNSVSKKSTQKTFPPSEEKSFAPINKPRPRFVGENMVLFFYVRLKKYGETLFWPNSRLYFDLNWVHFLTYSKVLNMSDNHDCLCILTFFYSELWNLIDFGQEPFVLGSYFDRHILSYFWVTFWSNMWFIFWKTLNLRFW